MVSEIRDPETAEIAVQAALTGHLLSTLHTNDAAGAVSRLLEMGVGDYLLASSLLRCSRSVWCAGVSPLSPRCRAGGACWGRK